MVNIQVNNHQCFQIPCRHENPSESEQSFREPIFPSGIIRYIKFDGLLLFSDRNVCFGWLKVGVYKYNSGRQVRAAAARPSDLVNAARAWLIVLVCTVRAHYAQSLQVLRYSCA